MRTLSSAVYLLKSYNAYNIVDIITFYTEYRRANHPCCVCMRERERERESLQFYFGLYFLAFVVFLSSKIVDSVFAK